MKAVEFEIEDELEQEKKKLQENAEAQINEKRKALKDKLNAAESEEDRAALKEQMKNFDRQQD
jgi:hypothetical protein